MRYDPILKWCCVIAFVMCAALTNNLKADEVFETLEEFFEDLPEEPVLPDPSNVYAWSGPRYSVPAEPPSYYGDQESQRTVLNLALKQCSPVSTKSILTAECMSVLTEYFNKEPVWKYTKLYYYHSIKGRQLAVYNGINRRVGMPYGYDDYSMEEIPTWKDIFDGRLEQRMDLFEKVTADPQCMELGTSSAIGIREEKREQCSAKEMFKYAAYLDACRTALKRLHVLKSPASSIRFQGLDTFEASEQMILEKVESAAQRDLAQRRVETGFLHASWVIEQCNSFTLLLTQVNDGDGHNTPFDLAGQVLAVTDEKFLRSVQQTHDVALRIAAKSGNEWAIRSFPLSIFNGNELVSDILEKYPLLMHRHLGSIHGGFRSELDWRDQERHRAKAYVLLEELAGPDVAQREFDFTKLHESIDYVRNGGELKYPRSTSAIVEEMHVRQQERKRREILQETQRRGSF